MGRCGVLGIANWVLDPVAWVDSERDQTCSSQCINQAETTGVVPTTVESTRFRSSDEAVANSASCPSGIANE